MGDHFTVNSKLQTSHSFLENDDRDKLRNSILKVFQNHAKSPGCIAHQKQFEESLAYKIKNSGMGRSNDSQAHTSSKCRTRSERNKLKLKIQAKSHSAARLDKFTKQVRRSGEISHAAGPTCSVTDNRLTLRLGMFNTGRKSDGIARGPIQISERLKAQTEEDMKKMLNVSDTYHNQESTILERMSECKSYVETDTNQENLPGISHRRLKPSAVTAHLNQLSGHSMKSPKLTMVLSPISDNSSPELMDTDEMSPVCSQSLPESPDVQEIVANIMGGLQPNKLFGDEDYYAETKDELYKILKLNAMTPSPVRVKTPASFSSSVTSATVRRLQDDVDSKPQEADPVPTFVGMTENESQTSVSTHAQTDSQCSCHCTMTSTGQNSYHSGHTDRQQTVSSFAQCSQASDCQEICKPQNITGEGEQIDRRQIRNAENEEDNSQTLSNEGGADESAIIFLPSMYALTSAEHLFHINDKAVEEKTKDINVMEEEEEYKNNMLPRNSLFDAQSILCLNDRALEHKNRISHREISVTASRYVLHCTENEEGITSKFSNNLQQDCQDHDIVTSISSRALTDPRCLLQQNDMVMKSKRLKQMKVENANGTQESCHCYNTKQTKSKTVKRAVAEYIVPPHEYMPGFHENYAGIQHETSWSPHQQFPGGRHCQAMEYLEHPPIHSNRCTSEMRGFLQEGSPDSDGSPIWIPVSQRNTTQPSHEYRYYPHKMFPF